MAATIEAAGVVLIRRAKGGAEQVCLVHRPRQNDWSLPKGKRERGEPLAVTARRETIEETGRDVVLGVPLKSQSYLVDGRPKRVDYWVGRVRPGGPGFRPGKEIDALEWVTPSRARSRLTYGRDFTLVAKALELPRTSPLVLLRHTTATRRADFKGRDDRRRPLARSGLAEARALVPLLMAFGVHEVFSSDSRRCMQTVAPLATTLGVGVREVPLISEELFDRRPRTALRRVRSIARRRSGLVVCSHRPVLPALIEALAAEFSMKPKQAKKLTAPLEPGAFLVLHRAVDGRGRPTGKVLAVERHDH